MNSALEGIKVIEIAQVAAAPMAARHLADFGAEVIHVEHPVKGDSWRVYQQAVTNGGSGAPSDINYCWEAYNRNKKGITVDLSKKLGQDIIHCLLEKADVFVTNLRPFELEKFDLKYETLQTLNKRLIFASIVGLGEKGPDRNNPAYDSTSYWTRSALPYMLSRPGLPCAGYRPALGDNVAALALANGIMMALYAREKTGFGQRLSVSLFQIGLYQLTFDIAGALVTNQDYTDWAITPPLDLVKQADDISSLLLDYYKANSWSPLSVPLPYQTKDGRQLLLALVQSDIYWPKLCKAIDQPEIELDVRFVDYESRKKNGRELYQILKDAFLKKSLDEWKVNLEGIPFGSYQNLTEAVHDSVARENNFFIPYEHPIYGSIEGLASPMNLEKTPASIRMPAPEFSQHTEEILLEHGFSWERISQFKELGIIS